MGENTFGYSGETADTYWRRRCVALTVGLVLFALPAWGLSQALRVGPASSGSGSAGSGPAGSGPAGSGPGSSGSARAGAGHRPGTGGSGAGTRRGRSGGASGGGSGGAGNPGGVRRGRSGAGHTGAVSGGTVGPSPGSSGHGHGFHGFQPAFCARRSIVLSLSAGQISYGRRQHPEFSLSIVSTQQHPCSFNVGSGHLALVIREGATRIWSSADCPVGTPSLVAALRRGVPTVASVGWDKHTSAPGCSGQARPVPPGLYTGYAVDGPVVSAPVTFRLG